MHTLLRITMTDVAVANAAVSDGAAFKRSSSKLPRPSTRNLPSSILSRVTVPPFLFLI